MEFKWRLSPENRYAKTDGARIPNSALATDSFPEFILGWTVGAIGV